MKVRAIKNCQVPDNLGRMTYRRGPEHDINDVLIEGGEVFEVPDTLVINPDVLALVERPASGKVRVIDPKTGVERQPAKADTP